MQCTRTIFACSVIIFRPIHYIRPSRLPLINARNSESGSTERALPPPPTTAHAFAFFHWTRLQQFVPSSTGVELQLEIALALPSSSVRKYAPRARLDYNAFRRFLPSSVYLLPNLRRTLFYGGPYQIGPKCLLVKIAKFLGFCVYRRSYLIGSPVIVSTREKAAVFSRYKIKSTFTVLRGGA